MYCFHRFYVYSSVALSIFTPLCHHLQNFFIFLGRWLSNLWWGGGAEGGAGAEDHGRRQVCQPQPGLHRGKSSHGHEGRFHKNFVKGACAEEQAVWVGGTESWARTEGAVTSLVWAGGAEGEFQKPRREDVATATLRREVASAEGDSQIFPGSHGASPSARSTQKAGSSGQRARPGRSGAGHPKVPARRV